MEERKRSSKSSASTALPAITSHMLIDCRAEFVMADGGYRGAG